jgi:hypothetical protein
MTQKKNKASVSIATRMDPIISDIGECLRECAELRAECIDGCADGAAGKKCRINCYKAASRCIQACRQHLDKIESLLLAEIAKEKAGA